MKNVLLAQVLMALVLLFKVNYGAETNQTYLTVNEKHLRDIEGSMSPTLNMPCSNFFKYACAEWHNYEKSVGSENLQVVDYRLRNHMKDILKSFGSVKNAPKFLTAVYNYYQACEDRQEDVLDYLTWMNANENVSWPLVAAEKPGPRKDWLELLALTRKYGFNGIFVYEDVVQRKDDPLKLTIELRRPPISDAAEGFTEQMYDLRKDLDGKSTEKFVNFHRQLTALTLRLINSEEKADMETMQKNMHKPSQTETRLVTLRELRMPWLNRYLQLLLDQPHIDPNMEIYVHSEQYFQKIYEFLDNYDNDLVCEYIQLQFLRFLKVNDSLKRRGDCVQGARHQFPLVMQWAYEKNHLELQWQTSLVRNIFNNLKTKFRDTLAIYSYSFDEDEATHLLEKIDKLQLMVGDISFEALERYYEHLTLDAEDYYGNRLKVNNLNFKVPHAALNRTLSSNSVELLRQREPDDINARLDKIIALSNLPYLYPRLNAIFLPVTLLQAPYYEDGLDDLYAYSRIGFHLAREIVKSFSRRYVYIDANGVEDDHTKATFQQNLKLKRHYERLRRRFFEENDDLDEAIDDLGALRLVYDTFAELHPDAYPQTLTIDAQPVTKKNVFFLSYAQNFCGPLCGTSTMGFFDYDLCDRVNKPVMHLNAFLKSFECSEREREEPLWF